MHKKIRIIEVKSELGAGTRGASLGPDAVKIAALDYGSNLFNKIPSIEVNVDNKLLFEPDSEIPYLRRRGIKYPRGGRIDLLTRIGTSQIFKMVGDGLMG